MNMNTKAAHTAEHAFIGSLQKILNKTLSVKKWNIRIHTILRI